MLIGNQSVVNKHPGRVFTSPGVLDTISKNGANRGRFFGSTASSNYISKLDGSPSGYRPPYSWLMAQYSGGLGSTQIIMGQGSITNFNLAAGLPISSGLTGSGVINFAEGSLVLQAISVILGTGSIYYAALTGNGSFTSGISGYGSINWADAGAITGLQAVAGLTGYGYIAGQLGALTSALAGLTGYGSITGTERANGYISADIVPYTELSPQSLAAAVWNSIASDFDTNLTMGSKLNDAGNSGDPWNTTLPGSYTEDQAGAIVKRLEDLINQVKTLTSAQL